MPGSPVGSHVAAMTLGILGVLVVSNVDNALRLVENRRVSQIHPMITLVGAFAGVRAFGLAGLVIGPLIMSVALELVRLSRSAGTPAVPAPDSAVAVATPRPASAARSKGVA